MLLFSNHQSVYHAQQIMDIVLMFAWNKMDKQRACAMMDMSCRRMNTPAQVFKRHKKSVFEENESNNTVMFCHI